jgi:membrane-bound lytic murein transglycosylase D
MREQLGGRNAAARYLKNLYALFNDWLMAGAAYNAGEGNIYRIIKNYPDINSYWDIKNHMPIKNETLDYIPKLIATIVLAKNRAYYGLEESEDSRNIHVSYETVRVPGHTYLEDIADLLNVPNKQITLLNADLVRQCTPPSNNGHEIKVPKGTAELVVKYVQKERPARVKKATHKVKKGENLSKIARANNVTVKAIMEANDLGDGDDIRIGQVLTLPGGNKPVKSEERHTHVVARGDTLRGIARQHGVSVEDIMAANDIKNPEKIQPKMTLNLPVKSDVPSPAKEIEYKVKKGDTIWSISRNFDVPAEKIMKWNKLSSNAAIFPGDNLKIRTR